MRTLLISELFLPRVGGTPTWFYQVYRRYPRQEIFVLTDHQPGDDLFDRGLPLAVCRVPMRMPDWGFLHPRSARRYLYLALTAWRIVRAQSIEIIHCGRVMTEGVIGYLLSRFARVPYCVYAHGEELGTALSSRQLTVLMRRAFGAARKIIANSENTRRLLWEIGVPDPKIAVIHPGVDAQRFYPCDNGALSRERLGLGGHKVLLTVGRLQRRKGHDMVIKALPVIAAAVPETKYLVVGTGEEEVRLRNLAEEIGVARFVHFAGRVSDDQLPAYYNASDVFIMPNREEPNQDIEGFGIVFLEANACGKPVIAGESGGAAEAIVHGETGLLVDGKNVQAIADAALRLLGNPEQARSMGRRGRERVATHFDWQGIVERTRRLGQEA